MTARRGRWHRPLRLALAGAVALLAGPAPAATSAHPALATASGTRWVEANGAYLRYALDGRGPQTIVLLHELSTALEVWDEMMPALVGRYRVLRYDQRGFGLSERISGRYRMDDAVEDLRALLDRLAISGPVVLVGSTSGGAIALKFAQVHPDRVRGVFAISPAAYMTPQPQRMAPADAGSRPRRPAREARTELREEIFPAHLRQAHPERLDRLRALLYSADADSAHLTTQMLYETGFADILPAIRCPVDIVATSLFTMRTVASVKEIADALPDARFDVIPAGHLAPIESPEMVVPLLLRFLRSLPPAASRQATE